MATLSRCKHGKRFSSKEICEDSAAFSYSHKIKGGKQEGSLTIAVREWIDEYGGDYYNHRLKVPASELQRLVNFLEKIGILVDGTIVDKEQTPDNYNSLPRKGTK